MMQRNAKSLKQGFEKKAKKFERGSIKLYEMLQRKHGLNKMYLTLFVKGLGQWL